MWLAFWLPQGDSLHLKFLCFECFLRVFIRLNYRFLAAKIPGRFCSVGLEPELLLHLPGTGISCLEKKYNTAINIE